MGCTGLPSSRPSPLYFHSIALLPSTVLLSSHHMPVPLQLYNFPLIFTFIFLSHNTPDTLFQFFHLLCTLWVTPAFSSPSPSKVNPRFFNIFTLFTLLTIMTELYNSANKRLNTMYTSRHFDQYSTRYSCIRASREQTGERRPHVRRQR